MDQRVPSIAKTWPSKTSSRNCIAHPKQQRVEMSLPRPTEAKPDNPLLPIEATGTTSSSWRRNTNDTSLVSKSKLEESDEDLFTVPDVEARPPAIPNAAITNITNCNNNPEVQPDQKRRRGRNPVDKEYRRLKRLLRNRVSAQQARERKKVYVNELESRAKDLQDNNSKLEEKISTLINENAMLRKVLMNTRPKVDESIESKQDQLGKC